VRLSDLLPATVGGTTLTRDEAEIETLNPHPNSDLGRLLTAVGRAAEDVELASAYDPTGALTLEILALRLLGAEEASLNAALRSAYAARDGRTVENVVFGGREIVKVTDAGDELGSKYAVAVNDVIYVVQTPDPELAEEAILALLALVG